MFKNILYLGEIQIKFCKKLTCISIIFRFQFRYILPFFTNVCKRLMLPGSLKHTSPLKGSQKLRTHILTKLHSFSKYCFAQSSVDTIWWYLQLQLKVPPNCVNWRPCLNIWFGDVVKLFFWVSFYCIFKKSNTFLFKSNKFLFLLRSHKSNTFLFKSIKFRFFMTRFLEIK